MFLYTDRGQSKSKVCSYTLIVVRARVKCVLSRGQSKSKVCSYTLIVVRARVKCVLIH